MNRHRDVLAVLGLPLLVPVFHGAVDTHPLRGERTRATCRRVTLGVPKLAAGYHAVLTLVACALAPAAVLVGLSGPVSVTGLRRGIYAALVALGGLLAL